jgi:hypothetical protein
MVFHPGSHGARGAFVGKILVLQVGPLLGKP